MRSRIKRHLWPVLEGRVPVRPGAADETIEPEVPPLELNGRDYAIFLLRLAAEIEHGLMVQYLFAAYSLGGPNVPQEQQARVRAWQETILGIAKEEMGHLVTVQNLLTALGGPLQFNREDYPNDNVLYETGFRLQALSLPSLATYVCAESPDGWETRNPDQARAIKEKAKVATGGTVNRVGRLYEELIRVIRDTALVPDGTFADTHAAIQASWDAWGRGFRRGEAGRQGPDAPDDQDPRAEHELVIVTVTSRETAIGALEQVGEQGEGSALPGNEDESHFQRFLEIYEEMDDLGEDELRALVRDVAPNPTTHLDGPDVGGDPASPGAGDDPDKPETTSAISNPEARMWAHLFNVRYRKLLVSLSHAFELAEDESDLGTPGPRGTLINRSFGEMYNLRSIAGVLVALPLDHAKPDDERAGPPFQMPHTLMLPHDEPDRWRLHRDVLDASATLMERIRTADGTGAGQEFITALAQAGQIERRQIELLIGGAPSGPAGGPQP